MSYQTHMVLESDLLFYFLYLKVNSSYFEMFITHICGGLHHTGCIHIWIFTHTNVALIESQLISNMWNTMIYYFTTWILKLWLVIQPKFLYGWFIPLLGIIRHILWGRLITDQPITIPLFLILSCLGSYQIQTQNITVQYISWNCVIQDTTDNHNSSWIV